MLRATGVTKSYGEVQALRGADLSVQPGEIVALLGKNGAGKTTLLSIISGLLKPDAGSVTVGGIDAIADPVAAAQLIGIAPQDTGVYPTLTVSENLIFFGELAGLDGQTRSARAIEVSTQLGLSELIDRRASKLSGGEKRRLHTACALVHSPKLLLLDEPTVGADVTTRAQLIAAVKDLAAAGAAVVYTTHYLPEVIELGADIVIIDNGAVLARGTRAELVERYSVDGVRFTTKAPLPTNVLAAVGAIADGDGYRIDSAIAVSDLVARLGEASNQLVSVETTEPSLETVFLAVTGNELSVEAS